MTRSRMHTVERQQLLVTGNVAMQQLLAADHDQRFSTFLQLVDLAGLGELLGNSVVQTVFAPTNAAFEALSNEQLAALQAPENRGSLQHALLQHFVHGEKGALTDGNVLITRSPTVPTITVRHQLESGEVMVGRATLLELMPAPSNGLAWTVTGFIFNIDDVIPGDSTTTTTTIGTTGTTTTSTSSNNGGGGSGPTIYQLLQSRPADYDWSG